jgi:hypothetical protein
MVESVWPVPDNARRAMRFDSLLWRMALLPLLLPLTASILGQPANQRVNEITSALQRREFDKALELLQPAIENFPNSPQLWMLEGLAYTGEGDSKSALSSYEHGCGRTTPRRTQC